MLQEITQDNKFKDYTKKNCVVNTRKDSHIDLYVTSERIFHIVA